MIKRFHAVILILSILFMSVFISLGYAVVVDNLSILGNAQIEAKPIKGVIITNVEFVKSTGVTGRENDYILPTNHETSVNINRTNGSITYKITAFNNTDVTYWYIGPRCTTDYGQNALIGKNNGVSIVTKDHADDNYQSFNNEDWIPPQTERDFYVTYTYGSSTSGIVDLLVNFHFDVRMDAVHDEFLAVLNDSAPGGGYETLKATFESMHTATGGLSISTESHPELFAILFDDLMINMDGIEKEAHIVIRRENLDKDSTTGDQYNNNGPKGCEYTLYITVEPLTPGTRPTVYAIAYSEGADNMGELWYQVGELYEGTAKIDANGNIDYSSWIATHKNYEMADGINYLVGAPNGDQYDIMKTMEQLISAEDQDIFNMIDNTNIFKKVYDIIQKHPSSTDPAVIGLKNAFYEASKFYVNHNNGQEFKVVRNKYTRAEIIYAIKNIQKALDYYNQAYAG